MFCCLCYMYFESWNAWMFVFLGLWRHTLVNILIDHFDRKFKRKCYRFSCFILRMVNEVTVYSKKAKLSKWRLPWTLRQNKDSAYKTPFHVDVQCLFKQAIFRLLSPRKALTITAYICLLYSWNIWYKRTSKLKIETTGFDGLVEYVTTFSFLSQCCRR